VTTTLHVNLTKKVTPLRNGDELIKQKEIPGMTGACPARLIARSAYMSRASACRLKKTNVLAMHRAIKLLLSFLHIKLPVKELTMSSRKINFIKKGVYCQAQLTEFCVSLSAK